MKYKFPKTIKVNNIVFKIKYDKEVNGGSFSYPYKGKPAILTLGTADLEGSPLRFFEVIMHELKEMIQIEQGVRHDMRDNDGEYLFSYHHKEHMDLCARLAGLLDEFIK